jgi:dTMP kinase
MFDSFLKYQSLVQAQFKRLQSTYGFRIVDGNQGTDEITEELRAEIQQVMRGR